MRAKGLICLPTILVRSSLIQVAKVFYEGDTSMGATSKPKLRIGVIGCGNISATYLRNAKRDRHNVPSELVLSQRFL